MVLVGVPGAAVGVWASGLLSAGRAGGYSAIVPLVHIQKARKFMVHF